MSSSPRIALITGGGRGIGRATALALARDGVDSIITYRTAAAEAAEVVAEIRGLGADAAALALDVRDSASFEAFARSVGELLDAQWGRERFGYLVNNAGVSANGAFAQVSEADVDLLVDVHLKGVFFLTQRLLGLIADGGSIVNVSSGLARVTFPERIVYGSVKGAVEVFTR